MEQHSVMSKPKQNPLHRLPPEERQLINVVVDALNDADLSKAESRIFSHARRGPRRVEPIHYPAAMVDLIRRDAREAEAEWKNYLETERSEFPQDCREMIHDLTRKKRLRDVDAKWLKDIVDEGVTATPTVDISKGRAKISFPLSFLSAQSVIAYVLLRLSALDTRIFACKNKKCGKVVLPESHVGPPRTKFCSPECHEIAKGQRKTNRRRLAVIRGRALERQA
jgi:hypothetical protein